jgi:hypothetical protein
MLQWRQSYRAKIPALVVITRFNLMCPQDKVRNDFSSVMKQHWGGVGDAETMKRTIITDFAVIYADKSDDIE